ncbi:hypothetical protein [Paraburkholderia sp. GAS348]|uniref:hypothetical protein n=1 Tax=Paraburkholderia sp. GAS348 TaxID=3035132 RepID=UPI003D1EED4A
MNHSEIKTQAVAAAQLIANAAAKKPRTAVGLPSDSDRHYDLGELRACGFDAMAATMVHHIKYNTKRHKCAKAYTLPYWQSFFGGCSKQQARTAVKKALAAKINDVPLLEISHGYFAKVRSPHYLYVGPGVEINTPPDADINTPSTEGNQQKETKEKIYKQGFPSDDPTGAIPEPQQATSESQNPESPPDAVVKSPKIEKKKTGPKPKVVTSNGDWVHYNRMVKTHDMDDLLKTCLSAGLVASYRKMLDDDECSMIERIEHGLKTSPHDKTDTLESLILGARDWPGICAVFEYLEEKDLNAPAEPNFKFFTKHILVFLADPELLECYPKATPATATPSAEVDVCVGTAEAVEPAVACAGDYDSEGYTHQDWLDQMAQQAALAAAAAKQHARTAVAAKHAAEKAAKTKATMFQGLKHAEAQAA